MGGCARDRVQNEPLTWRREERVVDVVLGQGAGGVRAVPLQEAVFLEGTALLGGGTGEVT